jgi:hypothetical protein
MYGHFEEHGFYAAVESDLRKVPKGCVQVGGFLRPKESVDIMENTVSTSQMTTEHSRSDFERHQGGSSFALLYITNSAGLIG